MEYNYTDEEKQQFIEVLQTIFLDNKEGLVEVEPGIWGFAEEHVEPNSKDDGSNDTWIASSTSLRRTRYEDYEIMDTNKHDYWIF